MTLISDKLARFTTMLRIRMVEEMIAARYDEQEMRCPVHLSIGQEAIAAGVCAAFTRSDYLFSTHRSHAHYLAKGGDLPGLIAEIYGRNTGCVRGRGGSMHLCDLDVGILATMPIVGSTLPIATGAAFGSKLLGDQRVTVVFFGDGTTEEGVFSESLNFAALQQLPIVFICENNLYSVYSPLEVRQPARDRVALAAAHGITAALGDGDDVEAIFSLTENAVARARNGGGPSFLEFATYRWREHCGPHYDNDIGYRSEAEFLAWQQRDPLARTERELLASGELCAATLSDIKASLQDEIETAFTAAREAPFPDESTLFTDLFVPTELCVQAA